jgi:hypothetical protein
MMIFADCEPQYLYPSSSVGHSAKRPFTLGTTHTFHTDTDTRDVNVASSSRLELSSRALDLFFISHAVRRRSILTP